MARTTKKIQSKGKSAKKLPLKQAAASEKKADKKKVAKKKAVKTVAARKRAGSMKDQAPRASLTASEKKFLGSMMGRCPGNLLKVVESSLKGNKTWAEKAVRILENEILALETIHMNYGAKERAIDEALKKAGRELNDFSATVSAAFSRKAEIARRIDILREALILARREALAAKRRKTVKK